MTARDLSIRALDVAVASAVLLVTAPLQALIVGAVRLSSPGPALFRQTRIGRDGRPFVLLKFRTMRASGPGPRVTRAGDARVTPVGRVLRRWKLDELPQLVNVLRGDMSLVGPRPDVPEYLAALPALDPAYRAARPGLTDPATLAYLDEEERLAAVPDPERHYVDVILPDKVRLSAAYQRERTLASDVRVLWRTARRILGGRRALAAAVAAAWLVVSAAGAGAAGGVLVVAPHPDDEVIAAAGVMATARAAGRDVAVVVVTNGDYYGTDAGLVREGESVDALGVLGFPEDAVVFLGYPDGGVLSLWNDAPGAQAYLSPRTGRSATYGARGLGRTDFHTFRTGQPGPYAQPALVDDVRAALDRFRPADVYVTGAFDAHPDHRAAYYAVRSAAKLLAAADPGFAATIHATIVHDPASYPFDDFWPASDPHEEVFGTFDDDAWPNPSLASGVPKRFDPTVPYVMPPALPKTILDWSARESLLVPDAMRVADYDTNVKAAAVRAYATQMSDHFVNVAHVKADEFFWPEPVAVGRFTVDVARAATATASSAAAGQPATAAIDGIVDGAPGNPGAEWAAAGPAPAALTLAWATPPTVDRIVLFDRVGLADHVTTARLLFDDGTTIPVGTLANDGRGDEVVLAPPRRVARLDVALDAAVGTPGLAEVEVFGTVAAGPCTTDADCKDGNACTADVCRNGTCAFDPLPDGTACGDGDACNGTEVCQAAVCTRQPAPDCDDGDPCTRDRCASPGGCVHDPICQPAPVQGRAGCSVGFVGLPRGGCEDGDPACDRDQTSDGVCRFDVILCANAGRRGCRAPQPLASITVAGAGTTEQALGTLAAALQARLPTTSETCVGPVPVSVALRASRKRFRPVRTRVRVAAVTATGRHFAARVPLACRPAPAGVVHQPPAPLVP